MNIGRPTRIIEVEPASLPVPEMVPIEPAPLPTESPEQTPVEPPA
jgi:hypothetical protein